MRAIKTISELKRELKLRQQMLEVLYVKRDKLARKLKVVEKNIAAITGEATSGSTFGVRAPRKGKFRGKGGKPLVSYLRDVLAKAPKGMRARDIAKAVVKAGYPTTSKSFYSIVAATLRDKKNFKRLARGVYTLA